MNKDNSKIQERLVNSWIGATAVATVTVTVVNGKRICLSPVICPRHRPLPPIFFFVLPEPVLVNQELDTMYRHLAARNTSVLFSNLYCTTSAGRNYKQLNFVGRESRRTPPRNLTLPPPKFPAAGRGALPIPLVEGDLGQSAAELNCSKPNSPRRLHTHARMHARKKTRKEMKTNRRTRSVKLCQKLFTGLRVQIIHNNVLQRCLGQHVGIIRYEKLQILSAVEFTTEKEMRLRLSTINHPHACLSYPLRSKYSHVHRMAFILNCIPLLAAARNSSAVVMAPGMS